MENKSPELEIAIKAALEAGKILEKCFEVEILSEWNNENMPVTMADKESEDIIKKIILEAFPEHSILGEETGLTQNKGVHLWHVDPLDGTRNFSRGIPYFAVSIALEYEGDFTVGVVYNPTNNSLFYAEKGKGAYWNDKKISVSKNDIQHCLVTVSSGRKEDDLKIRRKLMHDLPDQEIVSAVRDFACTAQDLAHVARGNTDADIKFGLRSYDFAAGLVLVREAGGRVTKLDGTPWEIGETSFVSSNGIFHDVLVEEIKKQKEKLGIM